VIFSEAGAQKIESLAEKSYRDGVLRKVADLVESKYVLADKAKGFADAFRAKSAAGAYDSLTEPKVFAEKVNRDLIAITGDKHTNFRVLTPSAAGEAPQSRLHHSVRYYRLRYKENAGFSRVDWLEPGIGYLELRRFYSFDQAKDMILAAMKLLSAARALIIDVRENGGGSGDYLSSFFLPYPTALSGSYSREANALTEFRTRSDIGMKPRTDIPVFLLIGPRTFSAAEAFAYDMQSRKRAVLVGEPSGGGGHSVDVFRIDDRFEFYISTERGVSPVTGGNWEGTGVIPDVRASGGEIMNKALELARKAAEEFGRTLEAAETKAVAEMQADLDRAEARYRENRAAEAEAALDSLFRTAAQSGMLSEFFMDVLAYEYRSGGKDPMLPAICRKRVELYPGSIDALERSAYVYYERGEKEPALRHFRKILELSPGYPSAVRMIREIEGK
jgi:tetratricopeptide (TPR) repeat protein